MMVSVGHKFPTPYVVTHRPYVGLELDGLNNEVPAWDDPIPVKVIGWSVGTVEQYSGDYRTRGEWQSRQVSDATLLTPPDLEVNIRDRFTLDSVDYEVREVRDVSHGFHGWRPGGVAVLKRITPKGRPQ